MKVLHLVKTAVGASWALRQTRELVKLGVEVHVAIPPGPLVDRYREAGVHVHGANFDFPVRTPWLAPSLSRDLRELVDQVGPELIHSHFVGTTLTMRLALGKHHRVPRVFQVPGPLHLEHRFFRAAELASAGPADYWVGSCDWTCRAYRKAGIEAGRVFLSYYGIDVERWRSADRVKGGHSAFRRNPTTKVVGLVAYMYAPRPYLGQRRGLKGHEDLIDALAICRREIPDLVGVFVGGAWSRAQWYEDRVVAYGRESDSAHNLFLGTRSDVEALYAGLDLAVCPSHSENVGAALESLLNGVPTIATNVGGFPDLVRNQETGWLVPPRNPPALAAAILDALRRQEEGRTMARRGQQLAIELFDVKKTSAQVFAIYEGILSSRLARGNRRANLATRAAA